MDSFISEHTAEYIIVSNIIRRISTRFSNVVPFYFWSSREGNSLSLSQSSEIQGRLIAIYARRPKIVDNRPNEIILKINGELLNMAFRSKAFDIPIFVGIPLVTSILDIRLDSPCSLFRIRSNESDNSDMLCYLSIVNKNVYFEREPKAIQGPLDDTEFMDQIISDSKVFLWSQCIESIKAIKLQNIEYRNLFSWGGIYKPFYLFIFD